MLDSKLCIPGYKIFRLDRNAQNSAKCRSGGLLIFNKNRFKCHLMESHDSGIEYLFIKLNAYGKNILFTLMNAPPFEHKLRDEYSHN